MIQDVINISIKDYLNGIGIETRKEGARYFCSSPFSSDRNWSFCIYPTNTYFDWANGHGGSIINLYCRLHNVDAKQAIRELKEGIKHEKYQPSYKCEEQQRPQKPFDYQKYINTNPEECAKIKAYAASRGITEGYFCGVFFTRNRPERAQLRREGMVPFRESSNPVGQRLDKWVRVPALGFIHVDKDLKPCGAKFRRIDNQEPRFSARGRLNWYVAVEKEELHELLTKFETPQSSEMELHSPSVYVVEGEANANSLQQHVKRLERPYLILSSGGVSSVVEELPLGLQNIPIKLIIDYDGDEVLYKQRTQLYDGLRAQHIKLILPKGEDINSLYNKNQMWMIENLLFN